MQQLSLNELIDRFGENKSELDSYKELCDKDNKEIKARMSELDESKHETDSFIAKVTVSERTSIDEDAMLDVLSASSYKDLVVRTKEYVDMDLLEKAIYSGDIDKETLLKLDACKKVTEVQTLKVTRK